jgi:hypothetical protein
MPHGTTLIPTAAIQRNALSLGCAHRRSSGAGRSERSETVIYESVQGGPRQPSERDTAQTTALNNETIAVKIPGPANELYFV